jgi:hypothetical protein
MTKFLKSTAAFAFMLSLSGLAHAQSFNLYAEAPTPDVQFDAPAFDTNTTIAIARLDGGRMIPTPHGEEVDWNFLDRRMETTFTQLGSTRYIRYVPELPLGASETVNKIDEIRLSAANEGFDYVLIYGVGPDAGWASFGGAALSQTGLTVHEDCSAWEQANAKALLIKTFNGEVLGAATADEIEYNIGQLADRVEILIRDLSAPKTQVL